MLSAPLCFAEPSQPRVRMNKQLGKQSQRPRVPQQPGGQGPRLLDLRAPDRPGRKASCPLEPSPARRGLRRFPGHPQDLALLSPGPRPRPFGPSALEQASAAHAHSSVHASRREPVRPALCAAAATGAVRALGAWPPAHLAPGPHRPLRAGLRVAGPRAVGSQRLLAEARLRAGHQALLLPAATGLGALGAGRAWGGVRARPGPEPPVPDLGPPGLTSLQEEVYQLRQGWAPQGRRAGGGAGPAWQWKGRSGRRSLSTHCTSRTEEPPPQLREHWGPRGVCGRAAA